jgi:lipoate-protein ligase A
VNGKKIIGSAQKRVNGKVLQHGALIMDVDVEKYCSLFKDCSSELIIELSRRMTSLKAELKGDIKSDEVMSEVLKGFEKSIGIEFEESILTGEELSNAKELERNKYSSKGWNYLR